MSIYVMTWVFMHSPAPGNDRLVLLAIADEADDDGLNARPGVRRIADKCRASIATAIRSTANLEAGGELLVLRPETRGRGRFNRYVVVMGRDPLALAEALGWPPPALTGPPAEWLIDEVRTDTDIPEEPGLMVADCDVSLPAAPSMTLPGMVADCDHSSDEERSTTRGNGVTSARQNAEERSGTFSIHSQTPRRSLDPCSIDPRAAAPGSKTQPPTRPLPDSVPPALSTGVGRRVGRPADPLDGQRDAAAGLAERARAREAELAGLPRTPPPPAWGAEVRRLLGPRIVEPEEVRS